MKKERNAADQDARNRKTKGQDTVTQDAASPDAVSRRKFLISSAGAAIAGAELVVGAPTILGQDSANKLKVGVVGAGVVGVGLRKRSFC